ncbi:MAG: OmpA family protein [Pyrinomonadaceae bacterium]
MGALTVEIDDGLDFNLWTAFADLMLALTLVLSLLLFLITAVVSFGNINLQPIKDNQQQMINSIATNYRVEAKEIAKDSFGISTTSSGYFDIQIKNDLNIQRVTFSDRILFRPDETKINPTGQEILKVMGGTLRQQLGIIKEIQIQGHADTLKSARFSSNTQLAAMRAISVLEFFQNKIGIDPFQTLISATTFGEFNSVNRSKTQEPYSKQQVDSDNRTSELRTMNRRIEIVLIYRH